MSIFRVKKSKKYVAILNAPLEDSRLSFGARGILAYLLTKPDGWKIWASHLYTQSPAGRKAVDRMLDELEQFCYLRKQRVQDAQGHWSWMSDVYEDPAENPDYDPEVRETLKAKKTRSTKKVQSAESPKSDNRESDNRESDNRESDNREMGDIDNPDLPITDLPITDSSSSNTEREGHTPSVAAAAADIYLSVTKIKSLAKLPEKMVDWLQGQERYMGAAYHPEAFRAAIKAADKEGKEALFDPERLDQLFSANIPTVVKVEYTRQNGSYKINKIHMSNGDKLSPAKAQGWVLSEADRLVKENLNQTDHQPADNPGS